MSIEEKIRQQENDSYLYKIKDHLKKNKNKNVVFVFSIILSFVVIVLLYLYSPYSKVYKIVINGNHYLTNEYIINKAKLNDYFLLNFINNSENNLIEDPLISDVNITLKEGNIILIDVVEVKAIGFIYEDDKSKLLLIDDNRIDLDINNMKMIVDVPLIEGFSKEELLQIEPDFEDIDYSIINQISEIHKYPVSYDSLYLEVVMRDGNYCFMSSDALKILNNYFSISSSFDYEKGHVCLYADNFTNSAYVSACPWQEKEKNDIDEEKDDKKIKENTIENSD